MKNIIIKKTINRYNKELNLNKLKYSYNFKKAVKVINQKALAILSNKVRLHSYVSKDQIWQMHRYEPSDLWFKRFVHYMLADGGYTAIGLVNAYPAILLTFCRSKSLITPVLEELVSSRDLFEKRVSEELNSDETECEDRIRRLVALETGETIDLKSSQLLRSLLDEVSQAKDILWARQEASLLVTDKKIIEEMKVVLITTLLNNKKNGYFQELEDLFESKDNRKWGTPLLFITYNDRAFVKFSDDVMQGSLQDLLDQFNTRHAFIRFKIEQFDDIFEEVSEEVFFVKSVIDNIYAI